MSWIRFAITLVVFMVLQAGPVRILAVTDAQVQPNLLLILLVACVTHLPATEAIVASFIIGLAMDVLTVVVGPHMLAYGVLGTLVSETRRFVLLEHMAGQMLVTFVLGMMVAWIVIPLSLLKGVPVHDSVWRVPLYSALLTPLLSFVLPWMLLGRGARGRPVHRP